MKMDKYNLLGGTIRREKKKGKKKIVTQPFPGYASIAKITCVCGTIQK